MDNAAEAAPETETDSGTEVEAASWQHDAGVEGDPNFEKFGSTADLAKSYAELSSMMGNSVRFPTKEAGEEDVTAFNEKMAGRGFFRAPDAEDAENTRVIQQQMGMPQEANGYKFDEIKGYNSDAEAEGAFKTVAHDMGLTQAQAAGVHEWLGTNIAETEQQRAGQIVEAMSALKGEWGQAFDVKLQGAKNAAAMLNDRVPGVSDYFDHMAETGQDANMIRLLDAFAETMGESGALPFTARGELTKSEAQDKIDDAHNNPNHWWHKPDGELSEKQQADRIKWQRAAYSG